ncbi:MAG: hypothetical protein HYS74_00620 [Parcubacteria group bacterium]|nr:hypothetical protein [Parcubacteria group bacterium]
MKAVLTFKPKQVNKNLLAVLPDRARDVLTSRFGLGVDAKRRTLESIGEQYGITRERVRQIENFALNAIKKSDAYEAESAAREELRDFVHALGALVAEEDVLLHVAKDRSAQNHAHFLLVLSDGFERKREDQHFKHRWSVDERVSSIVHQALHSLYQSLSTDDLVAEDDILNSFGERLAGAPDNFRNQETMRRWLNISKMVGVNSLGEWGLAASPNIRARGVRDYAYLVIRRHGSPLHFSEVAQEIHALFNRPAHVATCHNELIKDKERFVLVGRGLYGLAEWGYSNGVVREIIMRILKEQGKLSREDLVERVLKERYVKENTVVVNLQNKRYFKRDADGRYTLVG